jgi:hypothetical protein
MTTREHYQQVLAAKRKRQRRTDLIHAAGRRKTGARTSLSGAWTTRVPDPDKEA